MVKEEPKKVRPVYIWRDSRTWTVRITTKSRSSLSRSKISDVLGVISLVTSRVLPLSCKGLTYWQLEQWVQKPMSNILTKILIFINLKWILVHQDILNSSLFKSTFSYFIQSLVKNTYISLLCVILPFPVSSILSFPLFDYLISFPFGLNHHPTVVEFFWIKPERDKKKFHYKEVKTHNH